MKFCEKLLKARREAGLSQEELAARLGVSRQAVSKWETGEARPDVDKLAALCRELGLSMDWLCLDKQPEEKSAPPAPGKRYGLLILCAALIFALGVFAGRAVFPRTVTVTAQPPEDIVLADVQISWDWNDKNQRVWSVKLMPERPAEGLVVRVMVDSTPGVKHTEYELLEEGAYFCAEIPIIYGTQTFTAELELDGAKQRIPLCSMDGIDETGYGTEWYWTRPD
ncbi:MAG: helix-turn-helix domain-containing protein [Candidatus Heteroscillospira sp.]|jgi:transcriptional regulator with XRE-family HTH domain